ncbi:MAG: heme-binding domain-containing protein [Bacteroidota bacterium]
MFKKILLALIIVLIVAQFFRPPRNSGSAFGASDITQVVAVPDRVMAILQTACYDCHSNATNYPWYSNISPVSWWLNSHINDGKRELNFSIFATYSARRKNNMLEGTAELVKEGAMPLDSYTWVHKEAELSMEEKVAITSWATAAQQELGKK